MNRVRFLLVTGACLAVLGASGAREAQGQDPADEVGVLRAENKMLKAALETRSKKIAELEAQLEDARKPKPLEQDIARLKSRVAELEKENATLRTTQRALADLSKKGEGVKVVPVVGDETPLTKVTANPRDYIGKDFIVTGGVTVTDVYVSGYGEAKGTHVSLHLDELRADGSRTGGSIYLYLSRSVSKELVEAVTKTVGAGYGAKLVRVKAAILPHRYDDRGSGIEAELIDWQFGNAEGTGWQPWALGGKTLGATPRR